MLLRKRGRDACGLLTTHRWRQPMSREADDAVTLSDHAAGRLLARAAAIDAAGMQQLSRLRESALEAGIGAPAFDAALGELRGDRAPPAGIAPRWVRGCMIGVPDRRAAMIYYWVFAAGTCLGPLLALLPSRQHGGAVGLALFVTLWSAFALLSTWRAIRWLDRHGWDALP
jgi:hypothetical protein